MMKPINMTLILNISIAMFLLCGANVLAGIRIGSIAPEFTLPGADGKQYHLSQFKGKTVVLEWFNHQCPFVRKHYNSNNMQNIQKRYQQKGIVWLAVLSSAPGKQGYLEAKEAQRVFAENGARLTAALLDPSGKIGKLYGAKTTPHMYIIDPQGNLVYNGAIDNISSANPADIKRATNYVSKALDQSLNGSPISNAQTRPYGCSVKY